MFMLANALVQVSVCIPDIICVAQITLKFIDYALIVYNGRLLLFREENLADPLRLKDRLDLHSNFYRRSQNTIKTNVTNLLILEM